VTLRIGIVGAGMVSEHHLQAWRNEGRAKVVAIADPDLQRAAARAYEFGIPTVFKDGLELIRSGLLDAVDIASPVETHAHLCRAAFRSSLAVLCQKPLAADAEEAARLVAEIPDTARLMVHENWRFRPEYRRAYEVVRSGRLGPAVDVRLSARSSGLLSHNGRFPALVRQPFLARLDRLIVFELLVHHLDVLNWMFGPLRVETAILERRCEAVIGEDTASISLRGRDGIPIRLDGTFVDRDASPTISDMLDIRFTTGRLRLDDGVLEIEEPQPARQSFDPKISYALAYFGAIVHFASAVIDGSDFESQPSDHAAILRLVEDVYRIGSYPKQ